MTARTLRYAFIALAVIALIALVVLVRPAFGLDRSEMSVTTRSGVHRLTIELAKTPQEREHGLMGRKSMDPDHGMLFDFSVEQPVYFWMKNTPLSLDMVFIKGDGTVSRIEKRATPYSETVIPGGAPVRYVLELVGGASDRLELAPGDRVSIGR